MIYLILFLVNRSSTRILVINLMALFELRSLVKTVNMALSLGLSYYLALGLVTTTITYNSELFDI